MHKGILANDIASTKVINQEYTYNLSLLQAQCMLA